MNEKELIFQEEIEEAEEMFEAGYFNCFDDDDEKEED